MSWIFYGSAIVYLASKLFSDDDQLSREELSKMDGLKDFSPEELDILIENAEGETKEEKLQKIEAFIEENNKNADNVTKTIEEEPVTIRENLEDYLYSIDRKLEELASEKQNFDNNKEKKVEKDDNSSEDGKDQEKEDENSGNDDKPEEKEEKEENE